MKTTKKFLVMLVATLLMATNVWAGDVVVIKKLNGKVNNNVGTVTPLVKDGVCTLTVTPNLSLSLVWMIPSCLSPCPPRSV